MEIKAKPRAILAGKEDRDDQEEGETKETIAAKLFKFGSSLNVGQDSTMPLDLC